MNTVLVTGANGFIGRALTEELLADGYRVIGLGRGASAINDQRYTHLQGDLADWDSLPLLGSVDVLIHLAWEGSGGALRGDVAVQMHNVTLADAAVKLAKRYGAKRFMGVGTVTEGEVAATQFSPGSAPGAAFVYGLAKLTARDVTRYRAAQEGLEHIWARLGNTYFAHDASGRFLTMVLQKLQDNSPLDLTSGVQNYDFVYLSDAIQALKLAALRGLPGSDYYVGSGAPKSLRSFVEEAKAIAGSSSPLNFGGAAFTGVSLPLWEFSIEKLRVDTGYEPAYSFAEGVETILQAS